MLFRVVSFRYKGTEVLEVSLYIFSYLPYVHIISNEQNFTNKSVRICVSKHEYFKVPFSENDFTTYDIGNKYTLISKEKYFLLVVRIRAFFY
jgi:hypothetical protein